MLQDQKSVQHPKRNRGDDEQVYRCDTVGVIAKEGFPALRRWLITTYGVNMTLEEEKKFLARFAKAAGAGELLNVRTLKIAYEEEIGHPTSERTIYNLLARHQWRKLMPRPFHPERDEEAQEAYKKKGFARR